MAKFLKETVHVRKGFTAVALLAGSEVPEWAEDQVRDHLIASDAPAEVVEGNAAAEPETDAPAEVVEAVPSMDWTAAEIKGYADERGVDLGGASTKADMLAAISA